jgi:hypothetical protein
LVVAVTALMFSATSLWLSVLRPATLGLTYLSEHTKLDKGGANGIPAVTELQISLALANVGAKAGLIREVEIWHFHVSGKQSVPFAAGAVARMRGSETDPLVVLDDEPLTSPRAIEAGDVRALQLNVGLAGVFREERLKDHGGAEPDRVALARLLRDLDKVEFTVVCKYRRGAGLFLEKKTMCPVSILGEGFRGVAYNYWQSRNEQELLKIVQEGFGEQSSPHYDPA